MITLEQISNKLNDILNGTDSETSSLVSPVNDKYFFRVATEGFALKDVFDMPSGKNFIPVFVGALGGEFNPVKDLGEADLQVNVQFYYPAYFKNEFYSMVDFLMNAFVGNTLTFGGQKAICNISPVQFGELQDLNIKEFQKWEVNTFKKPIENSEVYMGMFFTLYISTAKDVGLDGGFIYGNSYNCSISIDVNQTNVFNDSDPIFSIKSTTVSSEPNSQQILGTNKSQGLPYITSFGNEISIYIKKTTNYAQLVKSVLDRNVQDWVISFTETFTELTISGTPVSKTLSYFVVGVMLVPAKGKLLTISLTLGDRIE